MGRVHQNAMTLEQFRDKYSEMDCDRTYWWGGDKIFPGDIVTSVKDDIAYHKWKVIAVGAGKKDEPMTVKVGDTVLYGKYAGTELNVEGIDYLIMRESDIFAII